MLRNALPRAQVTESYVCWQCRAKTHQNTTRVPSRRTLSRFARNDTTVTRRVPAQHAVPQGKTTASDIRDYMKRWQIHHAADNTLIPSPLTVTKHRTTTTTNRSFKLNDQDFDAQEEDAVEDIHGFRPFLKDDLVDVGGQRTFLLPGDMVELS